MAKKKRNIKPQVAKNAIADAIAGGEALDPNQEKFLYDHLLIGGVMQQHKDACGCCDAWFISGGLMKQEVSSATLSDAVRQAMNPETE